MDSTTTLKPSLSCSNFSSTVLSLTQDFSNTFTINFLTLLSHSKTTSTQRILNYEIWNYKFERGKLDCSVSEWVELLGGGVFIGGKAAGWPTNWWAWPAPHHGYLASPSFWWPLASLLSKISTPLVLFRWRYDQDGWQRDDGGESGGWVEIEVMGSGYGGVGAWPLVPTRQDMGRASKVAWPTRSRRAPQDYMKMWFIV